MATNAQGIYYLTTADDDDLADLTVITEDIADSVAAALVGAAATTRIAEGTGSPEGVVSAPPGSVWRQTNHADLGYCRWFKATGTGNTGWLPDFEGRWVAYTPTVTALAGTLTTASGVGSSYTQRGKTITVTYKITITANGTGATVILFSTPPDLDIKTGLEPIGIGRENALVGMPCIVKAEFSTLFSVRFMDGTYPGADNYRLEGNITYEIA